jgi:hypothetical protein
MCFLNSGSGRSLALAVAGSIQTVALSVKPTMGGLTVLLRGNRILKESLFEHHPSLKTKNEL